MRGDITGTTGSATVLAGYGGTYLIYNGGDLSGTITDGNGNSATFVSFTNGDLAGPNPVNGSANGLENFTLMHGPSANTISFPDGRALILENIDGFDQLEVFRASPSLFNLEFTAPYGFSSQIADLGDFTAGAVEQHAPRSLLRREGVDFRRPTEAELDALDAFQFAIRIPVDGNTDLDRFAVTDDQISGRAVFFGDDARCSKCHSGAVLATTDGTIPRIPEDINATFNTGTDQIPVNALDGMLPELPDDNGISTPLVSGRNGINNVVLYGGNATLNWVGGTNSRLISAQGVGNITVLGLNLTCSANCGTMAAIRASGNGRILIKNNTITGFDQAIDLNGLSNLTVKGNDLADKADSEK
ncbi:hypothetical protein MNBD_CHLOROFLEXI01-2554 [hydrothermal vent metagenome]|uniref:Cytochrome c domain-containing protein n=1 Tax=hydrothermal vent metagenome TaxID=652676 RepID=A0A3B0VJ54_9ZZZZ